MITLFIGGPWDGEWRNVEGSPSGIIVPILKPVSASVSDYWFLEDSDLYDSVQYVPQSLRGVNQMFDIYVLATMAVDEWMSMLVANYRPKAKVAEEDK